MSPDSIVPDYTNPQSLNRYSYVLNNPMKYTDPTGEWGEGLFPPEMYDYFSYWYESGPYDTRSFSYNNALVGTMPSLVTQNDNEESNDVRIGNNQVGTKTAEAPQYPTIQSWYPSDTEKSIDPYPKTTPMWFQDVGTLNTLAKCAGVCLLFVNPPAGIATLTATSWIDVGTTGIEAFKYETKTERQFYYQLGTVGITQTGAWAASRLLAASYLGADAGLVGKMMYNGRFYTTYNASGMSRYLPKSYALSVVGTETSASAVEESMNRLYPGGNQYPQY